jgi:hypothetical protein
MPLRDTVHELGVLIRSRHPLLVLEGGEDPDRLDSILLHLAASLELPLFTWSRTRGLVRQGMPGPVYGSDDPGRALSHVASSPVPALYLLRGMEGLLGNDLLAARMEEAVVAIRDRGGAILLLDAAGDAGGGLPPLLAPRATRVSLPGPRREELRALLGHILRDVAARQPVEVELTVAERERLLGHLEGLTLLEAEKILTRAIVEDGRLTVDDIRHVVEAKRAVVEREGLLEYTPLEEHRTEVADLAGLKEWLRKRTAILADPERARGFGLTFPKGILLVGVPGCGKSLSAKAVASEWALPLLRLDPSSLYNKYIGETEKNFRRAMQTAERMAPVVLWIDELEKAFAAAGGSEDGGVSQRILGSFLSWLQERRGDVFIVATANDISRLPPEFLRKGRFDEVFFVDLPDAATRAEIFRIHLALREQDAAAFDLPGLAAATPDFSGAEIEQVVISGLYTAFSGTGRLTTGVLLEEVGRTRPLATTMRERIEGLRAWSKERCVPAN